MAKPAKGWADDRGHFHITESEALFADLQIVIGGEGATSMTPGIARTLVEKAGRLHPILKRLDAITRNAAMIQPNNIDQFCTSAALA